MADTTRYNPTAGLDERWSDNGDGTYSLVVSMDSGSVVIGGVTIADGSDVAQGAVADAAAGDASGTLNAHLRYIAKSLGDVAASPVANTVLDRLKSLLTGIILAAGSAIVGKVGIDQTTPGTTNLVDTELPAAAALSDAMANPTTPQIGADLLLWDGTQWVRTRIASKYKDQATVAIGSIATVWTPASGKKIRLMGGTISLSAAASILFEDNAAATTVWRTPKLLADTPYNFDIPGGKLLGSADNVLKATSSAAANLIGTLYGTEE